MKTHQIFIAESQKILCGEWKNIIYQKVPLIGGLRQFVWKPAQGTEEILDSNGFDCGKQIGNGDNDSVFVYIYRKYDKTKE